MAVSDWRGDIAILLGIGDGTFLAPSFFGDGRNPVVGDFNEDGHQDLAVRDNGISILLGNGNGVFKAFAFYGAGGGPQSVAMGDFNEDGHQDLAVAGSNAAAILFGNGDGTFGTTFFYGAGWGSRSVAIGDFDEDDHQDLAVANYWGGDVGILLGNWKEIDVGVDCITKKIPQGESLAFSITIINRTDSTVTFDLTTWLKSVGGSEILLKGPRSVYLDGGHEKVYDDLIPIPDDFPLGEYIMTLEATTLDEEVLDEDSFRVRVVGSGSAPLSRPFVQLAFSILRSSLVQGYPQITVHH